eukprot:CAMPEP_0177621048 /NCGR_PEP_ID=MMETSP0419_2-20121207/27326_1 /TAXON_ID=582737 /ORGANISM="Tetraselmis sp., Strain GSL018" /LENGTH=204 /DNA_ID=CAMNT_0019120837 /DNA_START=148 /DNA_END=763 /DNA_ORIENTATION=-
MTEAMMFCFTTSSASSVQCLATCVITWIALVLSGGATDLAQIRDADAGSAPPPTTRRASVSEWLAASARKTQISALSFCGASSSVICTGLQPCQQNPPPAAQHGESPDRALLHACVHLVQLPPRRLQRPRICDVPGKIPTVPGDVLKHRVGCVADGGGAVAEGPDDLLEHAARAHLLRHPRVPAGERPEGLQAVDLDPCHRVLD